MKKYANAELPEEVAFNRFVDAIALAVPDSAKIKIRHVGNTQKGGVVAAIDISVRPKQRVTFFKVPGFTITKVLVDQPVIIFYEQDDPTNTHK